MSQQQIHIPQREPDEPDATPAQLKRVRELTTGRSLQGYRFDYRKLGQFQAQAVLNQLQAMTDANPSSKPRKQGPGCIASFAKAATTLVFCLVVLAGVAGGGYAIYWWMNQNPKPTTETAAEDTNPQDAESQGTTDATGTRESTIFEGLGVSDNQTPTNDRDTTPTPDRPAIDPPTPDPTPPPTPPAPDRATARQLAELNSLLVQLSQFTRSEFAPDIRTQSSQAMQRKLDSFPQALAALNAKDPALVPRIRAAVDAFADAPLDGQALRDEIKSLRQAIESNP
jgi:hypothetical protein